MVKIAAVDLYTKSIEKYRDHARNAYYALNSKHVPSEYDIKDYRRYLGDLLNNPTKAMLAMHEQMRTGAPSASYARNKKILEQDIYETRVMKEVSQEHIDRIYPKTKKIREYIIEKERVVLDKFKPAKGYNLFNKIAMKFKK